MNALRVKRRGVLVMVLVALESLSFTVKKTTETELTGIASYYANSFEGRITSNGEIFRQEKLTAAHKNLKFGTVVRVTNLKNDSSVIVRVNDRMPQTNKRLIDLSYKAAMQLNMIRSGLAKVKLEILTPSEIRN